MTDRTIENFAEKLEFLRYTLRKARLAERYLLFAKWSNFGNPHVQIEYFHPTPADLSQFDDLVIDMEEHKAQMRELQRQFSIENTRLTNEKVKVEKMYDDACNEIARLKREPKNPVVISERERQNLENGKLYLDEIEKRKAIQRKFELAMKEIARLERRIEHFEGLNGSFISSQESEKIFSESGNSAVLAD